ncbi:MAG: hypothetical protein ABI844_16495 [Saprospiraceae bacterium]
MKRKIIAVVGILGILSLLIGYKMYNKPHADIAEAKSIATFSAADLQKTFSDKEEEANTKYLDKVITVSGKIMSQKTEGDKVILQLETGDPMSTVICNLDPFSTHRRKEFKEGEMVQFKGTCSGYLSDVILDRCVEL